MLQPALLWLAASAHALERLRAGDTPSVSAARSACALAVQIFQASIELFILIDFYYSNRFFSLGNDALSACMSQQ